MNHKDRPTPIWLIDDIEAQKADARKLKPNVDILEVNINDIDSIKRVADWIEFKRRMR